MLEFQGQRIKRLATPILNAKEESYLHISLGLGTGEEFKYIRELVQEITNGVYIQFTQYLTKRHGLEQDILPTKLSAGC